MFKHFFWTKFPRQKSMIFGQNYTKFILVIDLLEQKLIFYLRTLQIDMDMYMQCKWSYFDT